MNTSNLESKIIEAQEAETNGNYMAAASYYKEALQTARELQESKSIKFCKTKLVELNKKSLVEMKKLEVTHEFTDQEQKWIKDFIIVFLKQSDKSISLRFIGLTPYLMPKVSDVKNMSKDMPIFYLFGNTNTISEEGHNIRGGSENNISWYMQMYKISIENITVLNICKILYMLMYNNNYSMNMKITELTDYFSRSKIIDGKKLKIVLTGIKKYYKKDYITALHILVPQFEALLLNVAQKNGIDVIALERDKNPSTRLVVLSEQHLKKDEFKKLFGEDFCQQVQFVLFEPLGFRLRHKIAHGEITEDECNFSNTTLIIYLYLVLMARFDIK